MVGFVCPHRPEQHRIVHRGSDRHRALQSRSAGRWGSAPADRAADLPPRPHADRGIGPGARQACESMPSANTNAGCSRLFIWGTQTGSKSETGYELTKAKTPLSDIVSLRLWTDLPATIRPRPSPTDSPDEAKF